MRINGKPELLTGLLLLSLAGTVNAGDLERSRTSHNPGTFNNSHEQTRGMHQRLHSRDSRQHGGHDQSWSRDWHDNHHQRDRDRHLYYGHERWRQSTDGWGHSFHGDHGYWQAFHQHPHYYGYRHRFYNNYNYYYNASGFFFPGYGYIRHGHVHEQHCPQWHFNDFATGFVLGAIILD